MSAISTLSESQDILQASVSRVKMALSQSIWDVEFEARRLTATQLEALFDADRIGGVCGLAAVYTAKRMQAAGIDAFHINFGIPNTPLTHITVLVRDGNKFFLFDPTHNLTLRDNNNNYVDVFSALAGAPYKLESKPWPKRDWLVFADELEKYRDGIIECRPVEPIAGQAVFACRRKDPYTFEYYVKSIRPMLLEAKLPIDDTMLIALMRQGLLNVGSTSNPTTPGAFLCEWTKQGLGVHTPEAFLGEGTKQGLTAELLRELVVGPAGKRFDQNIRTRLGVSGHVFYGPFVHLQAGQYRVSVTLTLDPSADVVKNESPPLVLEVVARDQYLAQADIACAVESGQYKLCFEITDPFLFLIALPVEVRLWTNGNLSALITSVHMEMIWKCRINTPGANN